MENPPSAPTPPENPDATATPSGTNAPIEISAPAQKPSADNPPETPEESAKPGNPQTSEASLEPIPLNTAEAANPREPETEGAKPTQIPKAKPLRKKAVRKKKSAPKETSNAIGDATPETDGNPGTEPRNPEETPRRKPATKKPKVAEPKPAQKKTKNTERASKKPPEKPLETSEEKLPEAPSPIEAPKEGPREEAATKPEKTPSRLTKPLLFASAGILLAAATLALGYTLWLPISMGLNKAEATANQPQNPTQKPTPEPEATDIPLPTPSKEELATATTGKVAAFRNNAPTKLPEKPNQFITVSTKIVDIIPSGANPKKKYLLILHPDNPKELLVAETTTPALVEKITKGEIQPSQSPKLTLGVLPTKTMGKYKKERQDIGDSLKIPPNRFFDIEEYQASK